MRVIRKRFEATSRKEEIRVIPLGDLHIGSAACDEKLLKEVVKSIYADKNTYWLSMGDVCLPIEAKILTKRGFVHYNELAIGESVLGFDGKNTVWTKLLGINVVPSAKLVRLRSKSFDITCTENHSWICVDNHKERWTGKRPKRAVVGPRKVKTRDLKKYHKILTSAPCEEDGKLNISDEEAALIGWVVTDGCISVDSDNAFNVSIAQSKEPFRSNLRTRFSEWFTGEYIRQDGDYLEQSRFNIKTKKFRELLNRLGVRPEELKSRLCSIVTELSTSARYSMLQAMVEAEGWQECGHWRFSQIRGPVLDAFYVLATLCGERLGLGKDNLWYIKQVPLMGYRPNVSVQHIEKEDAGEGAVWCPQTEIGSWVTKLGDQVTITGNCNFINLNDPRFSVDELAKWIKTKHLGDVAKAELDHYLEIVAPIASKCLAMVCGNHELSIQKHYERDIYAESVSQMKRLGNMSPETQLGIGYTGLLQLQWSRDGGLGRTINISLHHGFTGGRSPGGKANAIQKWLWQNECNAAIFGHSHNTSVTKEAVQTISSNGIPKIETRFGCYSGTFLNTGTLGSDTYSERAGFPILPLGGVQLILRPYSDSKVSVICS